MTEEHPLYLFNLQTIPPRHRHLTDAEGKIILFQIILSHHAPASTTDNDHHDEGFKSSTAVSSFNSQPVKRIQNNFHRMISYVGIYRDSRKSTQRESVS